METTKTRLASIARSRSILFFKPHHLLSLILYLFRPKGKPSSTETNIPPKVDAREPLKFKKEKREMSRKAETNSKLSPNP
jgi:hypothetical protein